MGQSPLPQAQIRHHSLERNQELGRLIGIEQKAALNCSE